MFLDLINDGMEKVRSLIFHMTSRMLNVEEVMKKDSRR